MWFLELHPMGKKTERHYSPDRSGNPGMRRERSERRNEELQRRAGPIFQRSENFLAPKEIRKSERSQDRHN